MKTLFQPTVNKWIPWKCDFRPTVCKPNPDKNDLLIERKRNFPTKTKLGAAFTKWLTAK